MTKRRVLLGLAGLTALGLSAALVVISGVVPIKASAGHWAVTEWFLHFAMQRSVATHSMGIEPPELDDPRLVLWGAGQYHNACQPCHGAPGRSRSGVTGYMTPKPPSLPDHTAKYDDAELFYIVRHGIKMTGMPAWPTGARPDEVWAMVGFLRALETMDAARYARLAGDELAASAASGETPRALPRCARCHGRDGQGRDLGAFPRLAGQRQQYLRQALEAYASGERESGVMGPIASELDSGDIEAVSRWYADQPAMRGGRALTQSAEGERIARDGIPEQRVPACGACHGPDAGAVHDAYPRLDGQHVRYLEHQLRLFTDGRRGGGRFKSVMKIAISHRLKPEQRRAVSRYYAGLR